MGAYADFTFRKGFLLDEERLRKLASLALQHLAKQANPALTYKVKRNDAFAYATSELQDILSENNGPSQKITTLEVATQREPAVGGEKPALILSLNFDKEEGTRLLVEGEDRNSVFVLFSDLKEYLKSEVNVCRTFGGESIVYVGTLFVFVFMIMGLVTLIYSVTNALYPTAELDAILASKDIDQKLNFIIGKTGRLRTQRLGWPILFMTLSLLGMLTLPFRHKAARILSLVVPQNLFLVGKEKERFDQGQEIKSKILWGVIIALLVGVVAGLIVWIATRTH